MLLRFRTTNHRSIRDSTEIVLTASSFRGTRPLDGDWRHVTNRVAGIFGPNGSGKTTVLDGMSFARNAIMNSSLWGDREKFPHHPFALNEISSAETSHYEFDFVISGVRHSYGFESDENGVAAEWLHTFPEGRRRTLFERERGERIVFGRSLKGENVRISRLMSDKNLFLSIATLANHAQLKEVSHSITQDLDYAVFSESNQSGRIRSIKKWIKDDERIRNRAQDLLRFADLGIRELTIENVEVNEMIQNTFRKTMIALMDEEDIEKAEEAVAGFVKEQQVQIGFWHTGKGAKASYKLDIGDESSGTVAWLSLALPALRMIDRGGSFIVDEIDASLHPRLTAALIALFKSEELNPRGAQLLFTSHDTSLMGHLTGETLDTEDIWFSEKAHDGATEIYPLTDFPVKRDHNVERRYLGGRYGAVPSVSWEDLRASLLEGVSA